MKRETFDEHSITACGRFYRVQFFSPKLWRFGFKFQVNRDFFYSRVEVYGKAAPYANPVWANKPIAQFKTGWTLALPTMSIKYVYSPN